MKLTKKVDFCAAHSIQGAGKCARKHGHNWEATIDVEHIDGPITHEAGFLVDVAKVKEAAFKYDHDDLDNYFQWASTENVAQQIADDALQHCIEANPQAGFCVRVNLVETKNNSAAAIVWNETELFEREPVQPGSYSVDTEFKPVGLVGARQNVPLKERQDDFVADRVNAEDKINTRAYGEQLSMPIDTVREAPEADVGSRD